jgi:hypothetical protein
MRTSVEVESRDGRWVVIVDEPNGARHERVFAFEQHATSWADGQRVRLSLEGSSKVELGDKEHYGSKSMADRKGTVLT